MKIRAAFIVGLLLLSGCDVVLYGDLPEQEANEMMAVLVSVGVDVEKERSNKGLISLNIGRDDFYKSVNALALRGYPKTKYTDIGELFKKSGLVSTPAEEKNLYIFGMNQELSATVSEIDGVLSARVHIVKPSKDPVTRLETPASASILIKHRPEATKIRDITPQLKLLVANSIEGLAYEKVSIVFVSGQSGNVESLADAKLVE